MGTRRGAACDRAAGARGLGGRLLVHAKSVPAARARSRGVARFRRSRSLLTHTHGLGFDPTMRTAVATAVLVSTLALLQRPATGATGGDLGNVAARAPRCERIARRPGAAIGSTGQAVAARGHRAAVLTVAQRSLRLDV